MPEHNMAPFCCYDGLMLAACVAAPAMLDQRAASLALCAKALNPCEARTGALSGPS